MTYLEAAITVLRDGDHPLSTQEITAEAIARGLIAPIGKTPANTMSAQLYLAAKRSPHTVRRLSIPGRTRARRDTVKWTVP